jgi:hypothetical protein
VSPSTPIRFITLWTFMVGGVMGCSDDSNAGSKAASCDIPSDDTGLQDSGDPKPPEPGDDSGASETGDTADTADTADTGTAADTGGADTGATASGHPPWPEGTDPFADSVVSFTPGPDAGFGADLLPGIILGSPHGGGTGAGSLHVLSLGEGGEIILEMTDLSIIDGPGTDLLVFENPFGGWIETGMVAASEDGETWFEWPCDPLDAAGGFPGCAGVAAVYASPELDIDPTDPATAGGDRFDLALLGLATARFIRIRDSGANAHGYGGIAGGFDLDAISAVNWTADE